MRATSASLILIVACSSEPAAPPTGGDRDAQATIVPDPFPTESELRPYPAPGDHPPNAGPGGPNVTFAPAELYVNCANLDGGPEDTTDHHNLVTMFDGYLLMPWAPESGGGGLSFFDVSDPCRPRAVGSGYSEDMRESHSIGIAHLNGRRYAAVNYLRSQLRGGVQLWDITDPLAPVAVASVETPSFRYPDAYARVTLSVFWQVPYIFVAGADNGVFIIDASDPLVPVYVGQYPISPTLRAGQIQAIGNLLYAGGAESPRALLLDISDPRAPQPLPGGDFLARDELQTPREAYFSTVVNGFVWFARKDSGGGVIVYDIHHPAKPAFAGAYRSGNNGGYLFIKDHYAFAGESEVAVIYDVSNKSAITPLATLDLNGDLDTMTPIGNIVVLSVDDDADLDRGSAIAPWRTDVDTTPPSVTWWNPLDGTRAMPLTSRIGVTFSEFIDPKSAWEGSVRLYELETKQRVDGHISVQETILNFSPRRPLRAGTTYVLELPAGGIADFNGNRLVSPFLLSFTTVGP